MNNRLELIFLNFAIPVFIKELKHLEWGDVFHFDIVDHLRINHLELSKGIK